MLCFKITLIPYFGNIRYYIHVHVYTSYVLSGLPSFTIMTSYENVFGFSF